MTSRFSGSSLVSRLTDPLNSLVFACVMDAARGEFGTIVAFGSAINFHPLPIGLVCCWCLALKKTSGPLECWPLAVLRQPVPNFADGVHLARVQIGLDSLPAETDWPPVGWHILRHHLGGVFNILFVL